MLLIVYWVSKVVNIHKTAKDSTHTQPSLHSIVFAVVGEITQLQVCSKTKS